MWLFLSRRLRMWLALAVALPILRTLLRRAANHYPASPVTPILRRVDTMLGSLAARGRSRRRR